MKLWIFSAQNIRNIEIGYDKRLWAVSITTQKTLRVRQTNSEKMVPYSRGLIYSSEDGTFTMPFRTLTYPDTEQHAEGVWAETWALPFAIRPLGPPTRRFPILAANVLWPTVVAGNVSQTMSGVAGSSVFIPNEITSDDWKDILRVLATESDDDCPEPI